MKKRTPAYCLHKATGQAVVRIDGKDRYLGKYDSPESHALYHRLIAEWTANGYTLRPQSDAAVPDLTVAELILQYWRWAEGYYCDAEGNRSLELDNLKDALRPLRKLYAQAQAAEFGANSLRAVREEMVKAGLSRTVINYRVNRIRRVFKWAASFEVLPVEVYQRLRTVEGLAKGRCKAREAGGVGPVAVQYVEAALPYMPPPVAALVRLQLLTGCLAGEAMVLRAIDLNMTGDVWVYRPHRHKNKHRGKDRVIYLGPQAQEVIRPFLTTDVHAYLFSPRAHVAALRALRSAARKTKPSPSELRRRGRPRKPKVVLAERYDRRSYRQAVVRACDKANVLALQATGLDPAAADAPRLVPRWSPLQLRHTAATAIRARFGVEAAKVILGHSRVETSQIYAEKDEARARQIVGEIG
jgi:integrase